MYPLRQLTTERLVNADIWHAKKPLSQLCPENVQQLSDKLELVRQWQLQLSQRPSNSSTPDLSEERDGDSNWTLVPSDEDCHLDIEEANSSFSHDGSHMFTKCFDLYKKYTCVREHEANVFAG